MAPDGDRSPGFGSSETGHRVGDRAVGQDCTRREDWLATLALSRAPPLLLPACPCARSRGDPGFAESETGPGWLR